MSIVPVCLTVVRFLWFNFLTTNDTHFKYVTHYAPNYHLLTIPQPDPNLR